MAAIQPVHNEVMSTYSQQQDLKGHIKFVQLTCRSKRQSNSLV